MFIVGLFTNDCHGSVLGTGDRNGRGSTRNNAVGCVGWEYCYILFRRNRNSSKSLFN